MKVIACAALAIGTAATISATAMATAATAQQPLSAIPWLSESILIEANPPPARPQVVPGAVTGTTPGTTAAPSPGDDEITVTTLGAISRDAVGLLTPAQTGFDRDLWGPTDAAKARDLILAHADAGVPAARALFRNLLLGEADTPPGAGSAPGLLLARIDRLLERGALEEAQALIERAGPDTPELFRRWFDIGLLLGAADPPCAALRQNPMLSPTLPARVFCLARGGDWNAAEITLTLGENVGSIPEEQEVLLARFLDPEIFEGEPEPPAPEPLTPLDFLMREAVGLQRPPGPLPLAFLHHDLDPHAPMRTRVEAAERLVLGGAVAPPVLFAAYRSGRPAASGGAWERAAAVQALDAALATDPPDPAALARALTAADALMAARGLDVALAQEYADAFAAQDMRLLGPVPRGVAVRLLLRAGRGEAAAAAAGDAPDAGTVTLLAVAGFATMSATGGDLERAALAGLALDTPGDDREARLAKMVDEGRQGEAILTALGLVEDGESVDPLSLRAALFTLRRAGQPDAAREIALQTLIRAGR